MRNQTRWSWILGMLVMASIVSMAPRSVAQDEHAIVITFRDGHQESFPAADVTRLDLKAAQIVFRDGSRRTLSGEVARIDFKGSPAGSTTLGQNHFIGKWKCGDGVGGTFLITLMRNGEARKSMGSVRGSWSVVDGEAHISWDDGWHDIIRKVDSRHEKAAYAPGRSLSEEPSNVASATRTEAEPI